MVRAPRTIAPLSSLAALVAVTALGGSGCDPWSILPTRGDPLYCDNDHACADPSRPACDLARNACVAGASVDMAEPDAQTVECQMSAQCPAERPLCDGGRCRLCAGSSDDAACSARGGAGGGKRCGPAGACVGCTEATAAADCSLDTPICGANACRPCQAHAECPSGICRSDGTCELRINIALVDNGGMPVATCEATRGDSMDGTTLQNAWCDIGAAVSALNPRPNILVTGTGYRPFTVRRDVLIVGPDPSQYLPTDNTVHSLAKGVPAVSLAGNNLHVELDGMYLVAGSAPGIDCEPDVGSAQLTVRSTYLSGTSGLLVGSNCEAVVDGARFLKSSIGLQVSGGRATASRIVSTGNGTGVLLEDQLVVDHAVAGSLSLDSSLVNGSTAGGVVCTGTGSCSVTNTFIDQNVSASQPWGGFWIDRTLKASVFEFNTVTRNQAPSGPGGVLCVAGGSVTLANSIVFGNTTALGSQVGPGCKLMNVVTGVGDSNGTAKDPAFVKPAAGDFHLVAGSAANAGAFGCCVDKALPLQPSADYTGHDHDGTRRPLGAGYDLGAHEVQ